jgi:hypothetical protein
MKAIKKMEAQRIDWENFSSILFNVNREMPMYELNKSEKFVCKYSN